MYVLEILSLCLIVCLCTLCSISDLQTGLIYNKVLVVFLVLAAVIDIVYYSFFAADLVVSFLANLLLVAAASLYLFFSHSFAGGDCKMVFVLAGLFPARYYWFIGTGNFTLIFTIAFALFAGYCYLLLNAISSIIKKRTVISLSYIKNSLLVFLKSYIIAVVYITLLNNIIPLLFRQFFTISTWATTFLCLGVAWCVGRFRVFKKWFMLIPAICIVLVFSFVTRVSPISLDIRDYLFVLILLICQTAIKPTLYESIDITHLEKGMILSAFSSSLMQTSITKGLPSVSTEDLRSRLTANEIECIKLWAKATQTTHLTIVKKIPFAIFISIGFLLYCTFGVILAWL